MPVSVMLVWVIQGILKIPIVHSGRIVERVILNFGMIQEIEEFVPWVDGTGTFEGETT